MSDDKGAPVPRGAPSTLKPKPSREFICVVGGPCNTFNGWISSGWKGADHVWITGAPPRTRAEILYYVNFTPHAVDVAALPKTEWRKHGWWEESVKALAAKKWKGSELVGIHPTQSHDLYWGNFVTPAARLFDSTDPWAAPLKRPLPGPGDIVTFMVYAPAYEMRGRVDYNASPYNPEHLTKPDASSYWRTGALGPPLSPPGAPPGPPSKPGYISPTARKQIEERARKDEEAAKSEPNVQISEEDVNFYIMSRTTGENTSEYIKKPKYPDHYMQYLHDQLLNSVKQRGAMTKLLLVRNPQEVVDYISKGKWAGKPLDSYDQAKDWDNPKPDDPSYDTPRSEKNYVFTPPRPVRKDTRNRPLKWTLPWYPAWDGTPNVDRKKVLVQRFDYIGHSITWAMMLQYGWTNEKGFLPMVDKVGGVEMSLKASELDVAFAGKVLAPDAHCMLWGCNLGISGVMDDGVTPGGLGPWIAKHFGGGVVCCDSTTSFKAITQNNTNMPTPDNGHWTLYPKPKK